MKKLYAFLCMLFVAGAASAYDAVVDGLYYTLNAEKLTATLTYGEKTTNTYSGDIVIPDEITVDEVTYAVTGFGVAFKSCSTLTSVTIGKNVSTVSNNGPFYYCPKLAKIVVDPENPVLDSREDCNAIIETATNTLLAGCGNTIIPNTVTAIGKGSFRWNTSLKTLDIPNSVKTIGKCAFDNSSLQSITIGTGVVTIEEEAFQYCRSLVTFTIANGSEPLSFTGTRAFQGCTKLKNVNLPNNLESVSTSMFTGCTALEEITIPGSLKKMGAFMFDGCTKLKTVIIEDGVEDLGTSTFKDCTALTTVDIPNSVIKGNTSFTGCTSLAEAYNEHVFFYLNPTYSGEYTIPDGIETIASQAFSKCVDLSNVVIPNTVTEINFSAFSGCTGLSTIDIPGSVETIPYYAFGNTGLTSVKIPEGVKDVSNNSFSNNANLETIELPSTMTTVGFNMLRNDPELTAIIINATTPPSPECSYDPKIADGTVYENAVLYVPKGCKATYQAAAGWKNFTNIVEMDDITVTVTKAMMATFYLESPVEAPADANILGLYTAREIDGEDLLLDRFESKIVPAKTPILLFANPGTYHFTFAPTKEIVEENVMKGVAEDTAVETLKSEGNYRSILTLGRGNTGGFIGFYNYTKEVLPANKCYIGLENGSTTSVKVAFPDGTETGISNVNANEVANEGVYDLSGRRVSQPTRGLYIVSGKKVMMK